MYKLIYLLIGIFLFTGCYQPNHDNSNKDMSLKKNGAGTLKSPPLIFSAPVQVDSSAYVMYLLQANQKDNGENEYGGKREPAITCQNIVFYNTNNGEYHVLDSTRKMLIKSYRTGPSSSDNYTNGNAVQSSGFIFYDIVIDDTDKDTKLTDKDAAYLFVSDRTGRNFRQISPDNYRVANWQLISKSNKVLMMATSVEEEAQKLQEVPFIYELNGKKPPYLVFDPTAQRRLAQLIYKQ